MNALKILTIHTTGSPSEDLNGLIGRIKAGDTPRAGQLLAILENILAMMEEDEQ